MRTFPLLSVSALALFTSFVACRNAETSTPTPSSTATTTAPAGATPASATPPVTSTAQADDAPATAACGWSAEHAEVSNWRTLIHSDDPSFGPADAKVTIVEFFEPNCPHCQHLHPTMKMVQGAFPNVRFVYKPVVFWPLSALQAQALYAAQAQGKFEAMLDAQMAQANPQTGLQEAPLRSIATSVGMDANALMQQLNAGQFRQKMMSNRQDFAGTGVTTVPLVLINGKVLGNERTTGCFGQLIRQQQGS